MSRKLLHSRFTHAPFFGPRNYKILSLQLLGLLQQNIVSDGNKQLTIAETPNSQGEGLAQSVINELFTLTAVSIINIGHWGTSCCMVQNRNDYYISTLKTTGTIIVPFETI